MTIFVHGRLHNTTTTTYYSQHPLATITPHPFFLPNNKKSMGTIFLFILFPNSQLLLKSKYPKSHHTLRIKRKKIVVPHVNSPWLSCETTVSAVTGTVPAEASECFHCETGPCTVRPKVQARKKTSPNGGSELWTKATNQLVLTCLGMAGLKWSNVRVQTCRALVMTKWKSRTGD